MTPLQRQEPRSAYVFQAILGFLVLGTLQLAGPALLWTSPIDPRLIAGAGLALSRLLPVRISLALLGARRPLVVLPILSSFSVGMFVALRMQGQEGTQLLTPFLNGGLTGLAWMCLLSNRDEVRREMLALLGGVTALGIGIAALTFDPFQMSCLLILVHVVAIRPGSEVGVPLKTMSAATIVTIGAVGVSLAVLAAGSGIGTLGMRTATAARPTESLALSTIGGSSPSPGTVERGPDMREGRPLLENPVFRIRPQLDYLRTRVFRVYEKGVWWPAEGNARRVAASGKPVTLGLTGKRPIEMTFELIAPIGRRIPLPYAPSRITGLPAGGAIEPGLTLALDRSLEPGESIAIHGFQEPTGFDGLEVDPTGYVQLPGDLEPRLHAIGRKLAAASTDTGSLCWNIEEYLRLQCRYSREFGPYEDPDPISQFLFEGRVGNCRAFSTAAAILVRLGGKPSRLVEGFLAGEKETSGATVFRASSAHAWVEVYHPDQGWMRFEATESLGVTGGPASGSVAASGVTEITTPGPGQPERRTSPVITSLLSSSEGNLPSVDVRGEEPTFDARSGNPLDETPLVRISPPGAGYLRTAIHRIYEKGVWRSEDTPSRPLTGAGDSRTTGFTGKGSVIQELEILAGIGSALPLPYPAATIIGLPPGAVIKPGLVISMGRPLRKGERFTCVTYESGKVPPSLEVNPDLYLQLPAYLHPQLRQVAAELRRRGKTLGEHCREIRHFLERQCRYQVIYGPYLDADPIYQFLFEGKRGACAMFATSAAILLRLGGRPARLVKGYLTADADRGSDAMIVKAKSFHAWVEVHDPARGWVFLEATPGLEGAPMPAARSPTASGGSRWEIAAKVAGERVPEELDSIRDLEDRKRTVDPSATPGKPPPVNPAEDTMRRTQKSVLASMDRAGALVRHLSRALPASMIVIGLLVAVLWTGLPRFRAMALVRRFPLLRGARSPARSASLTAYQEVLDLLARRGLDRFPSETPHELAARAREKFGELPSLEALTELYLLSRYAPESLDATVPDLAAALAAESRRMLGENR